MDVLVTGCAGFIGSHIAVALLERGYSVVGLDNFDEYYDTGIKRRNVERCRSVGGERFELTRGSITDESFVTSTFADYEPDYVYHEASQAGVRTSVENPKKTHRVNTTGLLTLLTAAKESGVERFVNASSSSVYGDPQSLPYEEDHSTTPQSPYAVTKLTSEHYCRVWNSLHDLPTVNLRYFTVYGPRMRPNMAITNFTSRCLRGEPPIIYGDGTQTRDFTHIDDIVEANLRLLDTDAADGETMNLGSTDNITINDLARFVIEKTGADVEPVYESPRDADAPHTHADISKASELIDYEPTTDIREGVAAFIDWYRANESWYDPLVSRS
jgi:UDP-glucose 4-epimerase